MLEAVGARTRLNIKGLTLESPATPPSNKPFDPKRDVTEKDWQSILKQLAEDKYDALWKGGDNLCSYLRSAFDALILRPERKLEITPSDDFLRQTIKAANHLKYEGENNGIWTGHLTTLYEVRVFNPELAPEAQPLKKMWREVMKQTKNHAESDKWGSYLADRYALLLSYPDRLREITPDETAWQGLRKYLVEAREEEERDNVGRFNRITYLASCMKILNPNRFHEVAFTPEDWEFGLADLEGSRDFGDPVDDFLPVAADLAIIAADSISVTEQGIQLVNNPGFREHPQAMPARRRF